MMYLYKLHINLNGLYGQNVSSVTVMTHQEPLPCFVWVITENDLGSLHINLWPTQTIDVGYFQPIASAMIDFLTSNLCCPLVKGPLQEVRKQKSQIERDMPDNPSTSDNGYS